MERVADDYEELDRYASLAMGLGVYIRWRRAHRAEMPESRPVALLILKVVTYAGSSSRMISMSLGTSSAEA